MVCLTNPFVLLRNLKLTAADEVRMQRAECQMVGMICGVKPVDRVSSAE